MADTESYYLPDEEKFGFFTSYLYDLFSTVRPMKMFHQFVLESVLSGNPKKILDIGFGTGSVIRRIVKNAPEAEVYGVEPSPSMYKVAMRKLKTPVSEGRVKLAMGSSRKIQFEEKFDVIYTSLSFHHWKNQEESIRNVIKYLQPDGSFKVLEYGDDLIHGYKRAVKAHALSLQDLEKLKHITNFDVKDSGEFRCVSFKPLPVQKQ